MVEGQQETTISEDKTGIDWRSEAQFWQTKYVEQTVHYSQVIAALSRSTLLEGALRQLLAQQQATAGVPTTVNGDSAEHVVST